MVKTFKEELERELRDPEFAKLYGAADAKSEFAIALARARDRAGVTQKELSDKLGLSQAYIAKLEGGEANPTLGTVGTILAVLGLSLKMDVEPILSYEATPEHARKGELAVADSSPALNGNRYSVRVSKRPH